MSIYLLFLVSTFSFAFKIDELEFGKIVEQNKKAEKTFTLTNNDVGTKIYRISIEGDKNIKVSPSLLNILPQQSKKFKLNVIADNIKGEHSYFLVIREVKKDKVKKDVGINEIIKIKQKYMIK